METLIENPWYAAGMVFLSQVGFLYLRTINVIYTAEKKVWPTIFSGFGMGLLWLVGIAIGADAVLSGTWQPIIAHLIGGAVGTFWAMERS